MCSSDIWSCAGLYWLESRGLMYCQFHTVERWADVIHDHGYVLFMQQWSTLLQQNSWFSNFPRHRNKVSWGKDHLLTYMKVKCGPQWPWSCWSPTVDFSRVHLPLSQYIHLSHSLDQRNSLRLLSQIWVEDWHQGADKTVRSLSQTAVQVELRAGVWIFHWQCENPQPH